MVEIRSGMPEPGEVEALVVPWFEGAPSTGEPWEADAERWLARRGSSGEASGWVRIGAADAPDVFVARLSPGERPIAESCRRAAGHGVRAARASGLGSVAVRVPAEADEAVWQAAAEGLELGDWRYDGLRELKGRTAPPETRLLVAAGAMPSGARAAARPGDAADMGKYPVFGSPRQRPTGLRPCLFFNAFPAGRVARSGLSPMLRMSGPAERAGTGSSDAKTPAWRWSRPDRGGSLRRSVTGCGEFGCRWRQ